MHRLQLLAVAACGLLIGCGGPSLRREHGSREMKTIFSPVEWPAASPQRLVTGLPGPQYWQQRVDYRIHATLDADEETLRASGSMTYINNSPDELPFLWLHLEQNVFRDGSDGSQIGIAQDFLGGRIDTHDKAGRKHYGLDLQSVRLAGGVEITPTIYDTLMRIDLPQPVPPRGGSVTLEMAWSFRVPRDHPVRMGVETVAAGKIFEIAQWFPCAAVYDDVHGWNTLRYLGVGEFYTNFGSYDVKISVPRSHLVAATGVLQNPEDVLTATQQQRLTQARGSAETVIIRGEGEVADTSSRPAGDGPLTWHFLAHDVRTFAFASSPAFIWDAAGLPQRGVCPADSGAKAGEIPAGTLVQSMYPAEGLPTWAESTKMLRHSIEHYSKQWYPYPYPVATNVNGPEPGMEYPMVIFCGRSDAKNRDAEAEKSARRGLYFVTTHEIGHNWFPMLVNTDERRYAWQDEGFNSFINIYACKSYFGSEDETAGELEGTVAQLAAGVHQPINVPPDQNTIDVFGLNQYAKTAVGMYALREAVLGPERFDDAFRRYVAAWAFKSPQPADFFRGMQTASGQDLDWFWRGWFNETGVLDQSVESASISDGLVCITFRNRRELVMPTPYRVTYADGATETHKLPVEAWFASNEAQARIPARSAALKSVEIDPDKTLPDVNRGNNRWP
jgi:Peptidase family M1 domain